MRIWRASAGIAPMADAHPFVGFEVFIVGEEMRDLLEHDFDVSSGRSPTSE